MLNNIVSSLADNIASSLAIAAALVGIVLTSLTILERLGRGFAYLHQRYEAWRKRPITPHYIVAPSAEEIYRYAGQSTDAEPDLPAVMNYINHAKMRGNIGIVRFALGICFALIILTLLRYGLLSEQIPRDPLP